MSEFILNFAKNKIMRKIVTSLLLLLLIFAYNDSFGQKTKEITALMEKVEAFEQDDSTLDVLYQIKGIYNWVYIVKANLKGGVIEKNTDTCILEALQKSALNIDTFFPQVVQEHF